MPLKDPEKRREYHRNYMRRRYQTDAAHRQKQITRVQTAKMRGRPMACEACGGPDPEGHHPDYADPTRILWLCRACHRSQHPGVC